jgi:hypothetical protein
VLTITADEILLQRTSLVMVTEGIQAKGRIIVGGEGKEMF